MSSVMFVCLAAGASPSLLPGSTAAGGEGETQDDSSLPIWSRKLQKASVGRELDENHFLLATPTLPGQDHQRLSVVCAGGQRRHVGLQNRQAQLEDGFDAVEEEAVDHADGTLEGQHAEEDGEEPGEGDGGERRQVGNVFGQFRQTLPDELLKHGLVHLSSCGGGDKHGGLLEVEEM